MGDAARHLTEHAQLLLPHHGLLRLAQVIIGDFERAVELRLVSGEADMLTQLRKKLALPAAEALRRASTDDENAEDLALQQQRSGNHRTQSTGGKPLWKRKLYLRQIGLVNQLPADTAGHAVLVDRNVCLFRQAEIHRQLMALDPNTRNYQHARRLV